MAGVKDWIAPFKAIKTFSSRDFIIDAPAIIEDRISYNLWGFPGGSPQHPLLQDPDFENIHPILDLPLRCRIEQQTLLGTTQVEDLSRNETVPFQSQIIDSGGQGFLFTRFIDIVPVNVDLFEKIHPAENSQLPVEFLDNLLSNYEVSVSENLLKPIYPPEKVAGMNYKSRYWEETSIKLPGFEPRKINKDGKKPIRPIQRGQIGNKSLSQSKQQPSFWDLLFVLLQPPLNLQIQESLALPHQLYPYQVKGVEFLFTNEHALLADDMGTGKTVMTLVALRILMQQAKAKKALILCPPSVIHEWRWHLEEWAPELVATFVRGTKDLREFTWNRESHVYVTSYSTLRNDVRSGRLQEDYRTNFDVIIIDEAHHIKNPTSAQSKAVKTFSPKVRWALTGTPIQNRLEDMQALFEFVFPNLLTSFDSEERVKIKVAPYFLRRRKQEVMPELPPKVRQDLELELDRDQQKAYEQAELASQKEISDLGDKVTKQHIFAKLNHLKQVCNFAPGKSTSPKLEDLKERVEEIIQSGQKVIIFSQYIEEGIQKLEKGLKPYKLAKIVGGQSDTARRMEIERFKVSQETPILLASIRSGGEGLNLAEASYVIHFDHWWNPAVMWQAEDRAHRRGQKNSVNIYSYWMQDTIDDRIRNILRKKGVLFENIVDGLAVEKIDELFTMDDLLEIIGVKRTTSEKSKADFSTWKNLTKEEIRQKLYLIKPFEFEDLVREMMHYLGFPNVKVTKRSGDGGVDVLSTRNTGHGVERIAAQVKRYKGTVGVPIAREFLGSIQDDPTIVKGYLITTGEFSSECIAYCVRHGIEMITGSKVSEYVKMFSLKGDLSEK